MKYLFFYFFCFAFLCPHRNLANPANRLSFSIVDSESGRAIEFATIIHNKNVYYSDKNGFVILNEYIEFDTIFIQHLGYNSKKLSNNDIVNGQKVRIERIYNLLDEVIVNNEPKLITIPFFTDSKDYYFGARIAVELATRISFHPDDANRTKHLKQIRIKVKNTNKNNPCRLHLFSVATDGSPATELLQESIVLTGANIKHGIMSIDISERDIITSDEEVFIGIEWLGIVKDNSREFNINPKLSISHNKDVANTYTRTVNQNSWTLLTNVHHGYNNPPNMLVSITYQ